MGAAIIVLVLVLLVFGVGGFSAHILWDVLIVALIVWAIGFFWRGSSGNGRWYRW